MDERTRSAIGIHLAAARRALERASAEADVANQEAVRMDVDDIRAEVMRVLQAVASGNRASVMRGQQQLIPPSVSQ